MTKRLRLKPTERFVLILLASGLIPLGLLAIVTPRSTATEELAGQAAPLQSSIAFFKVDDGKSRRPPRPQTKRETVAAKTTPKAAVATVS